MENQLELVVYMAIVKVKYQLVCKIVALLLLAFFLSQSPADAARLHPEKFYQEQWCEAHNGVAEYVLPDSTRVDCLLQDYAVEVDFADNFYEAIGQALFYAESTGKLPGVVLVMENPEKDEKYRVRLYQAVRQIKGFKIWTITGCPPSLQVMKAKPSWGNTVN